MPARYFELGHSIGEWVKANVHDLRAPDGEEFAYRATQFFFFCKCYKTYQAVVLLWRSGFAEDSVILARSLFEIVLQSKYITLDPLRRTRMYLEFDVVDRMRTYERIRASGDKSLIDAVESQPEALKDLKAFYKQVKTTYKKNHWWGKSIHWLSQQVGLESLYYTMYWEQAGLSHSAGTAINRYIAESTNGLLVSCDPGNEKPPRIPMGATWALFVVAQQLSLAIGAPPDPQLHDWHDTFVKLSEELEMDAT